MPTVKEHPPKGHSEQPEQQKELPKFTLVNVVKDIISAAWILLDDPQAVVVYYIAVVTIEAVLTKVIIQRVPYTEIDFVTYLQQVQLYKKGELNYGNIYGDSGPIVYPAGFVHLYSLLETIYRNGGLEFVQKIFGYLLTFTFILYVFVYELANTRPGTETNAKGEVVTKPLYKKPWLFGLLVLSKRVHSIYVLRLFNDCFVTFFIVITILVLQLAAKVNTSINEAKKAGNSTSKESSSLPPSPALKNFLLFTSSAIYSFAISVKMNALLFAPGFLFVAYLLHQGDLLPIVAHIFIILLVQVLAGWPFLQLFNTSDMAKEIRLSYLQNAFNFQRTFLYKWTINWKFLPEEVFQNSIFHKLLLAIHMLLLLLFVFTRWSPNFNPIALLYKSILCLSPFSSPSSSPSTTKRSQLISIEVSPVYVFYVMATSNLIGILCSRSLHYQFLSWYYFQLPFLYALTNWNYYFIAAYHIVHEVCWCTYPSNAVSSGTLVVMLASLLGSVWYGDVFKGYKVLRVAMVEGESKKKK